MKRRCKNSKTYKNISYDISWEKYENFKKDMYFEFLYVQKQLGYNEDELSIERKNNYKGYFKQNCTFVPICNQGSNKKSIHRFRAISPDGKITIERNAAQFAKRYNLNPNHVRDCIRGDYLKSHKGWKFENLKLHYK